MTERIGKCLPWMLGVSNKNRSKTKPMEIMMVKMNQTMIARRIPMTKALTRSPASVKKCSTWPHVSASGVHHPST